MKTIFPATTRATRPARAIAALLAVAAATPALAHPGHDGAAGFVSGFLHPLTGADHLLAMMLVGVWSGIVFPRRWWVCPAAFMAFLLAGFGYGISGGAMPIAELLIAASVVCVGAALLFDIRPPLAASSALVTLFAIGHGHAHGAEMPAGGNALLFASGFLLATGALHLAGVAIARFATGPRALPIARAAGGISAVVGATMLWSAT